MSQQEIHAVRGTGIHVPGDDIDTDRIIPARYLRCVTFDGLGEFAFYDERFDDDGGAKDHPFNDSRFDGASILLSGRNFGCGSSREHAPQSLHKAGIKAVIAQSFAEIFFGNCTTLGMVCATASGESIAALAAAINADPSVELVIDVDAREARCGDLVIPVGIPDGARDALTSGEWDPIGQLIANADAVRETYDKLPYVSWMSR